jgi:hypothetical protein
MSARRRPSIGRQLVRGAVAGAAGTMAMDLLLYLRQRRAGGKDQLLEWEFGAGIMGWHDASAPGRLGQKVERAITGQPPPDSWARTTTNLVHWATGIGWGVQYGLVAAVTPRHAGLRALAVGPVAWLSGYVILPLAGVYEPIWKYDARTLADDLSAHLVFGATTSAVFAVLGREGR